jgi:hypothetical protein
MDDNILKVAIGTAGVLLGAIITALASAYSARQKVREIELTYKQKLHESYLTNARQYIKSVYIPLSIALLKLLDRYLKFRDYSKLNPNEMGDIGLEQFQQAYQEYKEVVSNLLERGADAYLTAQLEQRLQSFNRFLDASMTAQNPVISRVLDYRVYIPGTIRYSGSLTVKSDKGVMERVLTSMFGRRRFNLNPIPGISVLYQMPELLAAPITSVEFQERMIQDIQDMKFLIKEVTLGSHA